MRTIVFTTTNWNSKEYWDVLWNGPARPPSINSPHEWLESWKEPMFGLCKWHERVRWLFGPIEVFLACGTWSDPQWSPIPVVNSGVDYTKPYNPGRWSYAGCAQLAAHAYLMNRRDWDLAVQLDYDCLVGAVDFEQLRVDFCNRPDVVLTPSWFGKPGGPLIIFKREGILRWLHHRRRANLVEDNLPVPMELEDEMREIFDGAWWNPWPNNDNQRYEDGVKDDAAFNWQFVRSPSMTMRERYVAEQTSKTKPFLR